MNQLSWILFFLCSGENTLSGPFGLTKMFDDMTDFYEELLLGKVSPTVLTRELAEKRKQASESKPDLTGNLVDPFV